MPAIRYAYILVLVLTSLVGTGAMALDDKQDSTFEALVENYLKIQVALANDRVDGIADSAAAISKSTAALATSFSAHRAGVAEEDAQKLIKILPALQIAAAKLAKVENIEAARSAFGILSEAMVSYRNLTIGKLPHVAYCPMAKKSWLQNGKEIANPYYGSAMRRCGTIVDK